MKKIKICIVGIGNCASSLIQGLSFYDNLDIKENIYGLMHNSLGEYLPSDIEVVLGYDIDKRKVDKPLEEAIFQLPNCTQTFCKDIPKTNVIVKMGKILDGFSQHLTNYDEKYRIVTSDQKEPSKEDVINKLKESKTDVLVNYCPVGSQLATEFYADCCLEARVAFVNAIPQFIASDPAWAEKFKNKGIPILGDDIKSQLGATILHRTIVNLFNNRGVKLDKTYQLNVGGNTDFLNMLNRDRLKSKKISKTEAVQSSLSQRLEDENIHIGPSDYVPWQKDNKVAFIRMEGKLFGGVPMNLELRLSVEDSPNSSGCIIDCIRLAKIGLDREIEGPLIGPSAFYFKHPIEQYNDDVAFQMVEDFIVNKTVNNVNEC
jgi:myo-inositol-1-phosphate synthase